MNIRYWFTVGEGVRKRHPVTGQLLKGPELVDTVEYGLGPVDQPTAHLLQVAQHSDVTVWLHPGRRHPYHHHLWIRCHQFLLHSQTWRMMWWGSMIGKQREETRRSSLHKNHLSACVDILKNCLFVILYCYDYTLKSHISSSWKNCQSVWWDFLYSWKRWLVLWRQFVDTAPALTGSWLGYKTRQRQPAPRLVLLSREFGTCFIYMLPISIYSTPLQCCQFVCFLDQYCLLLWLRKGYSCWYTTLSQCRAVG